MSAGNFSDGKGRKSQEEKKTEGERKRRRERRRRKGRKKEKKEKGKGKERKGKVGLVRKIREKIGVRKKVKGKTLGLIRLGLISRPTIVIKIVTCNNCLFSLLAVLIN